MACATRLELACKVGSSNATEEDMQKALAASVYQLLQLIHTTPQLHFLQTN
jgi:hypothetical protein